MNGIGIRVFEPDFEIVDMKFKEFISISSAKRSQARSGLLTYSPWVSKKQPKVDCHPSPMRIKGRGEMTPVINRLYTLVFYVGKMPGDGKLYGFQP